MKPNHKNLSTVLLLCSALLATPAMADWQIDNQNSELHFVTTKAGKPGVVAIQEVQTFKKISGQVEEDGNFKVNIDLASVDTGIEIRDQRMKDLLFKVADFPKATFVGKVDMAAIKRLPAGATKDIALNGKITLSGVTKPLLVKLRVVKLASHRVLVETRAPFIINAADFRLEPGLEALRAVMGLSLISGAVPVNFSIVLK